MTLQGKDNQIFDILERKGKFLQQAYDIKIEKKQKKKCKKQEKRKWNHIFFKRQK